MSLRSRIFSPLENARAALNSMRETSKRAGDASSWEPVYPQQQKSVYEDPSDAVSKSATTDETIYGVRTGFTGNGKKMHIIREIGYGDSVFLCGAERTPKLPLRAGNVLISSPGLCKSCINLYQGGAR